MKNRIKLPMTYDVARLQAEAAQFPAPYWVEHFNKSVFEGNWSGLALRAVGGDAMRLYPDLSTNASYEDTPLLTHCPYIAEVLAGFECETESVRLLKLHAGSSIREHRDYVLGYEDGVVRFHIPVLTHPEVAFYHLDERVVMAEGECWYLNFNHKHRVDNSSPIDRTHLIIDCLVNEWVTELFKSAEADQLTPA